MAGEQTMRPAAERKMPEWQRDALDRERYRPRNIQDVLSAVNELGRRIDGIQARLYLIEKQLSRLTPDESE